MTETTNPQSGSENSIHYAGWAVAGAAFVGVMTSFAPIVPYTFSLFLNPLHAAFGWQREAIGGTFALAAITVALVSPGIGALLDRFAPRRIILPSILIFALALTSLSRLGPHGGSWRMFQQCAQVMEEAANALASYAIASGDLRPDVDPIDLMRAIYGLSTAGSADDWPAKARRFVEILLQGSRP